MRWQWLVVLSSVLGLGSPVLGQGIPSPEAGSSSAGRNFSADGNGLRTEGDWLLPLRSSADRIDGVPDRGWVAVGLLEEQAVTLLDGASGDPLWQVAVGFAPSVVRVDEARQVVYASGPNAPGLVALDLLTGELIQAYGLPAGSFGYCRGCGHRAGFRLHAFCPKSGGDGCSPAQSAVRSTNAKAIPQSSRKPAICRCPAPLWRWPTMRSGDPCLWV
jgi:hypothetical protein